ncbi:MAG: primosomal protein N' [Bacteroidales bacterium]|jgi:primosomal protein N' (replication factor Y)|nr:primosomal protein N' [Bacteroidales bacterium]
MYSKDSILFVDVILTLHLPYSYCYRLPQEMNEDIAIGQRVAVQFGSKKIYSGIVVNITDVAPKVKNIKYVIAIIEKEKTVTQKQIDFFKWIAEYYIAYVGDVLTAALPSAFRLKSETVVEISPYFSSDITNLDDTEKDILDLVLNKTKINIEELEAKYEQKNILPIISSMIKKDVLVTDEELYSKYTPKKETYIILNPKYKEDESELKALFEEFDKKAVFASQRNTLLLYLSLIKDRDSITKTELLSKRCSLSSLTTLLHKDILRKESKIVSRLENREKTQEVSSIVLNEEQTIAYNEIINHWNEKPVSLIYGVTGSGKTEIYIKLIEKIIKEKGQVLYLIPEIAITTQLITRLQQYFGNTIGVYNSKFSTMERAEVWNRVKTDKQNERFNIILGSRSAVFLPFVDLKMVVIDEEHDTSFKQNEPVPHYNGRDCALYLAKMFSAKTILASATPNIESYYLAQQNIYQLLTLKHQYHKLPLPEIQIADMKDCYKYGELYGIFSKLLYDNMIECLKDKKQIIIFQNRRGYAPHLTCNICGYVPKCPNCDVSLVLHKQTRSLNCHYCGYHTDVISSCPDCHSHSLKNVGIGTERIEEEIRMYFPKANVERMDLDTTRTKDAYTKIIEDFSTGKIDILTGTQIVTKGLDFENVGLVGVLDVDSMLHYPDFRSYERVFQILTQVSGRAGRKNTKGKVIIQTFSPYHQAIRDVSEHNYEGMYDSQIVERKLLNFPPFCRMIKITLQHKNREELYEYAKDYAIRLRQIFGFRLFGPQEPTIARLKNLYNQEIWLKIEKQLSYSKVKVKIREMNEEFSAEKNHKNVRINIDVDPV